MHINTRIRTTGYGSDRYGPCEKCKKHASEIFINRVEREYTREDGSTGVAYVSSTFGHFECLDATNASKSETESPAQAS